MSSEEQHSLYFGECGAELTYIYTVLCVVTQ